ELHALAIGLQLGPALEQRPQPREAPAERAARIVGAVPEERAELLAGVLARLGQQIPEQRPRLLRRRQREPLSTPLHRELAEHAQRQRRSSAALVPLHQSSLAALP